MKALINIASLVTVASDGKRAKTGSSMRDLGEIRNGAVIFDDVIRWRGPMAEFDDACVRLGVSPTELELDDCSGLTVLPGFVDSHTHIVYAGSRAHEFARRLSGVPYTTIAAEGGGILTTMRAVREASREDIVHVATHHAQRALEHGTTFMEVKSGYGLSLESEVKLLNAVVDVAQDVDMRLVSTFMAAHDVPPEFRSSPDDYVRHIVDDMLPAVKDIELLSFCDVFTDKGFFTVEQSEIILQAASGYGLGLKVHADEIAAIGASNMAARLGCVSADHLEFTTEDDVDALRDAGVVCTLLPGTAYTLRLPPPNARMMIDRGAIVALATDCNPGSCLSENMQNVLSLACMTLGMSIEEAIVAATLHGAAALRVHDRVGSIDVGKEADMVLYDVPSYADIVYHFGVNHVLGVYVRGEMVA